MDSLADRIVWAIETIKADLDRNITDEALARKLGTNKNTIGDYRRKKGLIKGVVLERMATVYHFSPEWLLSGKGEPLPGAAERYPETCAPEKTGLTASAGINAGTMRETGAPYGKGVESGQIKISDTVRMAIEVLESDSPDARMLAWAIRQVYRAAQLEKRISVLEAEIRELKDGGEDKDRDKP